jgi:hypothetical protein
MTYSNKKKALYQIWPGVLTIQQKVMARMYVKIICQISLKTKLKFNMLSLFNVIKSWFKLRFFFINIIYEI